MYTLVSASMLGFDLVRREGGGAVASIVLDALALRHDHVELLAGLHEPDALSVEERVVVDAAGRRSPLSAALGEMSSLVGSGRAAEALALVEQAPMAGLPDLLRCLREEVFDWTWIRLGEASMRSTEADAATAVVADAVTGAFLRPVLVETLTERLVDPWARAHPSLAGLAVPLGPYADDVDELLARLARLDGDGLGRLRRAGLEARARGGWPQAMHSASWAVHMADRVRPAACAQLRAARLLADSDIAVRELAAGTWNLVSGAVQATMVQDLLDEETRSRLVGPLLAALDPA